MAIDLPGGDVTIPGLGSQPIVLVAAVAGGALGLGVLLYRRTRGGGDSAPIETVTTPEDGAAPVAAPASGGGDTSAALSALGQSLTTGLAAQQAQTAAAIKAQQEATAAALGGLADSQRREIDTLFGMFDKENTDRDARDQAARDQQAARDAAQDKQAQTFWEKLLGQMGGAAPVDPVIPSGGGGRWTGAQWRQYAANAGLLADNKTRGRRLPAGALLMVYEGDRRAAAPEIALPKAYDGTQDTRGYEFLGRLSEPLIVRAARKTADHMEFNTTADPQAIMLGYLRSEAKSGGGWSGTGFTAGPADVAAGFP